VNNLSGNHPNSNGLAGVQGIAPASIIPVIDIAPFRDGSDAGVEEVAGKVREACESFGFLIIGGHGVPSRLIEDLRSVAAEFFALPEDTKLRCRAVEGRGGYRAVGSSRLGSSRGDSKALPDIAEFFSMQRLTKRPGPPIWPDEPVAFADVFTRYHDTMERLALTMMEIFAVALGLDRGWFLREVPGWETRLLANHYPARDSVPPDGQIRLGAHTDFGTVTILHHDDAPGGLQVQIGPDEWFDVPAIPGHFTVNIGDLLAMWTNQRWVSTVHRVVNAPPGSRDSDRISIPFFQGVHADALISCIPTCTNEDHPPLHEAVRAGEWMATKLARSYG
jgi:isopenicillin N synthase-like dioxygenase